MPEKTPILAPSGASAALASHPDTPLETERYHIYDANPAPWWVTSLWLVFFIFAFTYLMVNLLQLG
jgi:hypothetical protein